MATVASASLVYRRAEHLTVGSTGGRDSQSLL